MSLPHATARLAGLATALVLATATAHALDLGALGQAADTAQRASGAAAAGQQALDAGRSAAGEARSWWEQRERPGQARQDSPPSATPAPASAADDQGGPRRVLAVLGDSWADSARRGQAVVALMDAGPYFVQRQAAHVAPAKAQWLATPRGDSTSVAIDLPAEPEGTTYDLATGRARPGGRGVRVFALSVHADLPQRAGRRSLDAIEQHAMLRASSVRLEWPAADRQSRPEAILEATGGKLLVWASDAGQRFPAGLGADGRLFTADDPLVSLPRGYTVVTIDAQGLRFDRGREAALSLHTVLPPADLDLSRLAPGDAAQALVGLIAERHPLAAATRFDATALRAEYGPRLQAAADRGDSTAQAQAWAELGQRLRDGQYRVLPPGQAPLAEPTLKAFLLRSVQGASHAYVALDSFADGATGQLARWERALASAQQARVAGLVIDLRGYRGDDAFQLLPHMLASLYTRERPLRMQEAAQRLYDPAARIWRSRGGLGLPAQLALAAAATPFTAPVAVLVSPACTGPCELFAAWLQHSGRADVVATGPSTGATGQATRVHLPGGWAVQLPLLQETGPAGTNGQGQGQGLAPRVRVPMDTAFTASAQAGGDPLLDAAVLQLERARTGSTARGASAS
jgi:hypothetical protein